MILTKIQREFLNRILSGEQVVRSRFDQYRWHMCGTSCSRPARKLKSSGLIRCIYRTASISDVKVTEEGLRILNGQL